MIKQIATLCALALTSIPLAGYAGQEIKETKNVIEKTKETCITGDLGINVVSQYISRGVIFENQGGIIEPYADLYFKLYESDGGFLNKVSLNLGIWNSFHSRKTDAGIALFDPLGGADDRTSDGGGSTTRSWYEFDFTAGISFTFAKNFTFTPSYYMFLSPNDGFNTFQGINLKLAYDTTDALGFNLAPFVQVLFEMENKAGTGADEGIYYEVGIAPSFPLGPVTLAFPITAGFGSNDFYGSAHTRTFTVETEDADTGDVIRTEETVTTIDDESFGFVSAGIVATYNLTFIPECYGTWSVNAGYTYYHLGDGTSDFNTAERGGAVRDYNENEHVFSTGILIAF